MNLKRESEGLPTGAVPRTLEFLDERVVHAEQVFRRIQEGEIPGYCLVEKYWGDLEAIIRQSSDLMASRKINSQVWQNYVRKWRDFQYEMSHFLKDGEVFEQRMKPFDQQLVSSLELALIGGDKTTISEHILDLYARWLGRSGDEAGELLRYHEEVDYPDLIENLQKGQSHRRLPIKLGQDDLFCLVLKNEMDGFVAYVSNTAWNVLHDYSQKEFLERSRQAERRAIQEVGAGRVSSARAIQAALKK